MPSVTPVNTFGPLSGTISLALLDQNFSQLANAINALGIISSVAGITTGPPTSGTMLTVIENIGSTPLSLTNCAIDGVGNVNSYVQIDVHNSSNGALASSDVIATADSGSDTTQYVDMGVNSSGFSNPAWTVSGPLDAYVYASDGNLTVGTAGTKSLIFHTGGLLAANIRLTISPTGYASFSLPPKVPSYTVATLPAPASAGAGAKAFVSDSTAFTFASVVVGGGSSGVPVYCDGTSWRIG